MIKSTCYSPEDQGSDPRTHVKWLANIYISEKLNLFSPPKVPAHTWYTRHTVHMHTHTAHTHAHIVHIHAHALGTQQYTCTHDTYTYTQTHTKQLNLQGTRTHPNMKAINY